MKLAPKLLVSAAFCLALAGQAFAATELKHWPAPAAKQLNESRQYAGFDQAALDTAARLGLGNGCFEDSEEDSGAIVEEFFSVTDMESTNSLAPASSTPPKPTLTEKLELLATDTQIS